MISMRILGKEKQRGPQQGSQNKFEKLLERWEQRSLKGNSGLERGLQMHRIEARVLQLLRVLVHRIEVEILQEFQVQMHNFETEVPQLFQVQAHMMIEPHKKVEVGVQMMVEPHKKVEVVVHMRV